MTANEFVEIVREGSDKLRVDDIVLSAWGQNVHGKGMLRISKERILIDLTINDGEEFPNVPDGIYTKKDHWKLKGMIEDALEFRCDCIKPSGNPWYKKVTFELHPMNLVPSEFEAMSVKDLEIEHLKRQNASTASEKSNQAEAEEIPEDNSVHFKAVLLEYPFFERTHADGIKGEIDGYDWTLKKDTKKDLHVALISKKEYCSSGEQEDWRKFYALMNALAFVHGTNAWPYRIEYWRAGRKINDQVTAASRLAKTFHTPWPIEEVGKVQWSYTDTIKKVAAFFGTSSNLSKEISNILFLFREADNGVHSEITTTALCVLFENLVRRLFDELKLREKALSESTSLKLFAEAIEEVSNYIQPQIDKKGDGYKRLYGVVSKTQLFDMQERFHAVTNHYHLQWEDDMKIIFNIWSTARNSLVHDRTRADREDEEWKKLITDESQIAGAINILLLKLFGYSGQMRCSAIEEKYRQI